MVHFVKQMKRRLRRRKVEMDGDDEDVFGLWDGQSSDECLTSYDKHDNNNDDGDDAHVGRPHNTPRELKEELSRKDPKFRQECKDEDYIRHKIDQQPTSNQNQHQHSPVILRLCKHPPLKQPTEIPPNKKQNQQENTTIFRDRRDHTR